MMRRVLAAFVLVAAALPAAAQEAPPPARLQPKRLRVVESEFAIAQHRLADVDGDGRTDVELVGETGEVRVWRRDEESQTLADIPIGNLALAEPQRALLALADVLGTGRAQLVVLSGDGVRVHAPAAGGSFEREGVLLSKRARLALRSGRPVFAEIAKDVNGDGSIDLLVPTPEACQLWLQDAPASGSDTKAPPTFRLAATVKVDVSRERTIDSAALSDVLESSFRIPALRIEDVNGDGRKDLVVEDGKLRSFHVASADGSFPAEPTVTLDLAIFKDTTAAAELKLGRTLAGSDDQRFESRDLNADGIPDYVIAHRRKVWVFHGTKGAPAFTEPAQTLRVADDVTAMLLVRLDDDPLPDLLLLRVQVPTVATILRGLLTEWDVDIAALGYANRGADGFATTAGWKGEISLRLPAILGVLKDPDALIRKFETVSKRFRGGVVGDFDGDGRPDVALADTESGRVDVWYARAGGTAADDANVESEIGRAFFGGGERVWDLDRVLSWLGALADQNAARLTGGRPPDARIALRPPEKGLFQGVSAGDVDGAKGEEIVIAYELDGGRRAFELWK